MRRSRLGLQEPLVRPVLKATAPTAHMPPGLPHRHVVTALPRHLVVASALPALSAGAMAEAGAALLRHLLHATEPQAALTAPEATEPRSASLTEHRAGLAAHLPTSVVAHVLSSLLAASTMAATPPAAATPMAIRMALRKAARTTPTTLVPCRAVRRAVHARKPMVTRASISALGALLLSPEPTPVTTPAPALPPMLPPPPPNPPAPAPS